MSVNENTYSIDEDTPLTNKELRNHDTKKDSTTSKKTTTLLDDDVPLSDSAPDTGDTIDIISILYKTSYAPAVFSEAVFTLNSDTLSSLYQHQISI